MKRILSQCSKELSQFRRDRLTLALAFLLPVATLFIFGFAIRLAACRRNNFFQHEFADLQGDDFRTAMLKLAGN
ncbi:hypothetical protein TUMEXPCC7403_11195 [Tumidithrix helvetica PCC 7403]